MDFSLSEEQQEVRDLARKILEDRCTHERLRAVEASADGVDLELWRDLARANLLGVGLPEAVGGSDLGFFTTCLLLEEIGRAVAPVPALATLVMAALPIARFGSPAQQQRWLPGVVSGELILSAGLLEAGSEEPARPAIAVPCRERRLPPRRREDLRARGAPRRSACWCRRAARTDRWAPSWSIPAARVSSSSRSRPPTASATSSSRSPPRASRRRTCSADSRRGPRSCSGSPTGPRSAPARSSSASRTARCA